MDTLAQQATDAQAVVLADAMDSDGEDKVDAAIATLDGAELLVGDAGGPKGKKTKKEQASCRDASKVEGKTSH